MIPRSSFYRPLYAALVLSLLGGASLRAAASGTDAPVVKLPDFDAVATPVAGLPAADRFAGAVTTVGAEQLKDLAPLDFASALRRTPGVTITRYNQVGAFGGTEGGAIFLRGLGASRPGGEVRTTFDGVPVMNGLFNHPLLDLMSLDAAAALEVHHRAAPLDFGSAFGAVNIATPRVASTGRVLRASLAGGSFGTVLESVAAGERTAGGTDYFFSQGYRRSDGARPDAEGSLANWFFRAGQTLNEHWSVSYRVNRSDNRTRDPGALGATAGSTKGESYATSSWIHLGVVEWNYEATSGAVRVYRNDGHGDWVRRAFSGEADNFNSWRLEGARWRQTVKFAEAGEVLLGADFDTQRGTSISQPLAPAPVVTFRSGTTELFSPYAGVNHAWRVRGVTITPSVGARYYQHDTFGSHWSPQAGLVVAGPETQLRIGASRAVNFPGLEVQTLSTFIPPLGNSWTRLQPEEAEQVEVAVRQEFGPRAAATLTVFQNDVSNRYVIAFPPPPPPRYTNVGAYRSRGAELSAEISPRDDLKLFVGATWLDNEPATLPYAPEQTYTGGVNWRFAGGWLLSVDGSYVSAMHVAAANRAAGAANPVRVGAQFALNARLVRRFAVGADGRTQIEVFVAGENLTDRDFAYAPGYPIPGVNGLIGVRFAR
jgi:outer membrane cobalamin receptor